MKHPAAALLILLSGPVMAETTLILPAGAELHLDVSTLTKLEEESSADRYRYVATSLWGDQRFNLSVHVEPIDCKYGKSLKQVSRCFVERLDSLPGVIKEADDMDCRRNRCDILYVTNVKLDQGMVRQLHFNGLFVYRGGWVDVHLTALNPTADDSNVFAKFATKLKLVGPN